jgi:chloride channel 3/4/5
MDLRSWVDQTPITVHPNFPIEMVAELFKKMGLRYILVTQNGKLKGLITKKDILKKLGGRLFYHHHASLQADLVLG